MSEVVTENPFYFPGCKAQVAELVQQMDRIRRVVEEDQAGAWIEEPPDEKYDVLQLLCATYIGATGISPRYLHDRSESGFYDDGKINDPFDAAILIISMHAQARRVLEGLSK